MHIAGHVGFTIGFFTLLNKNRNLTYKTCLILAVVALLPDILDSGIHMMIPKYPTHGIFHSLLFYGLLLPLTFITTAIKYINSSNPPIPPFLKGGERGFKLFAFQREKKKEKKKEEKRGRFYFRCENAEELPYEDEFFDIE